MMSIARVSEGRAVPAMISVPACLDVEAFRICACWLDVNHINRGLLATAEAVLRDGWASPAAGWQRPPRGSDGPALASSLRAARP